MSAKISSALEGDYIRRTERFKALSTFDQFLRGIHRGFLPIQGGLESDLGDLFRDLKLGSSLTSLASHGFPADTSPEGLDAKLAAAAARLRAVDIPLSPSLTRRYFEKVRPSDARVPFYLLRFYLLQPDTDENMLDKVDYLATVLAAGTPDPAAPVTRSREESRQIFERLLKESAWPRIDSEAVPEIVRAFDDVATQISAARGFQELADKGYIENLRTLKRQVSRGLGHPEILAATAACNLTARAVFSRLYEREERNLREAARRIDDLEKRIPQGQIVELEPLHRFRESRRELQRQTVEGTIRWRQLVQVQRAASDALRTLAGPETEPETAESPAAVGAPLEETSDKFWGPCLKRILSAVEAGDSVRSVEAWRALADCKLDEWEADAARRAIARKELTRPERVVLFAAALRVKAEAETEATRRNGASAISPDALREARATLSHASGLDRTFASFAAVGHGDEAADEVRRWTRTRLRLLHATSGLWLALDSR
jgi:hypothetical protein